ncbi:MAG: hypothetical protein GWO38_27615, partial [Phycisphaerae bacterium]|nr:hypothetical protein [Phycisphaerae bacterium]NIX01532.1 hypothetical protein [Phycisphaerae bacterium]NIX31293.1 hypothetical protein [Phycisphaerae bacterium]
KAAFKRFPAFMAFAVLLPFLLYSKVITAPLLFVTEGLIGADSLTSSLANVPSFFTDPFGIPGAPLALANLAVEYAIFGEWSTGYHVVSIALLSISSVLVGLLARSLIGMRGAVCAAWLFAA